MEKGCFDRLSRDVPVPGARNPTFSPAPALPKVLLRRPRRPFAESTISVQSLCATELAAAPPGGHFNWRYCGDFFENSAGFWPGWIAVDFEAKLHLKGFQINYFPEFFSCPVVREHRG